MMHQNRGFPNNAAVAAANMRRMNQQHMPNAGKESKQNHNYSLCSTDMRDVKMS